MQQEIKSNSNGESHTRGPWKLHAGTKTFHVAARDYYVAETKTDTIEDLANARLIAAAPELLAVLKQALETEWRAGAPERRWHKQARKIIEGI